MDTHKHLTILQTGGRPDMVLALRALAHEAWLHPYMPLESQNIASVMDAALHLPLSAEEQKYLFTWMTNSAAHFSSLAYKNLGERHTPLGGALRNWKNGGLGLAAMLVRHGHCLSSALYGSQNIQQLWANVPRRFSNAYHNLQHAACVQAFKNHGGVL